MDMGQESCIEAGDRRDRLGSRQRLCRPRFLVGGAGGDVEEDSVVRQRERVYPHFVARIIPAAPAVGWKVAAFVRDDNGQESPLPPHGILVESSQGVLRAVVRPVNSRSLSVTL